MKKSASRSKISSEKHGFLVLLSAPSGCGKTTILTRLLKRHSQWVRSISVTTRPSRLGERNGRDYEFVTGRQFEAMKKRGEFLEWAQIFGQSYGTPKSRIEEAVQKGRVVLLAVDVQGARNLRRSLSKKIPLLTIFVLPPSVQVLRERLEKRQTDSPEEIERRIERAQEEIKMAQEYDGTVINLDLDQTVHEIEEMISEFEKKLKGGN